MMKKERASISCGILCVFLCFSGIGMIFLLKDNDLEGNTSPAFPARLPQRASIASVEWNFTWSGPGDDIYADVVVDENGNLFACGRTSSWSQGGMDSLLVKYDTVGNCLWNTSLGGSNNDEAKRITIDNKDKVCIIGDVESWGVGLKDVLVVQYNSTFIGNPVPNWNSTYGGSTSEYGTGIAVDRNNSIYISGNRENGGGSNAILAKCDPLGFFYWNNNWNLTNSDIGQDIAMDWQNNFYLVGICNSTSLADVTIAKFNASLDSVWNQTWGWSGYERVHDVTLDDLGNLYLTGETNSTIDGNFDMFLVKIDSNGHHLWNTTWNGSSYDCGYALATDHLGHIFIVGETQNDESGENDVIIVKYDGAGNLQWNITYGSSGKEAGLGITVDRYGDNIWVVGYTTSWYAQGYDAFILKINDQKPIISHVKHKTLLEGAKEESIQWTIIDSTANLTRYVVYQDGMIVQDQPWNSGEVVNISISNLIIGTYNYTIIAWDGTGDHTTETVLVTVVFHDLTWIYFIGIIGALLLVYFLFRARLKKLWKRRAIKFLVGFTIICLSTIACFSPVLFFNSGGRYEDKELTSLGVPYESPGDIYMYTTYYSETTLNPGERIHTGLDFMLKNNSPVIACAPGQVMEINLRENQRDTKDVNRYQIQITIRYSQSIFIRYNFEPWTPHVEDQALLLTLINVQVGDWVLKGDVIGFFLKIGDAAHIHFSVGRGFPIPVDTCPVPYMAADDLASLVNLAHSFEPTFDICY